MRFVEPESIAGRTRYEDEHLRIRLRTPEEDAGTPQPVRPLIAVLDVENKRSVVGRIDAARSCLADPELGAFNLSMADRVLPPGSFVRISNLQQSFMTVNLNMFSGPPRRGVAPRVGSRQRIFLRVPWDDGAVDEVNLAYEIVDTSADMPETIASESE